MKLYTVLALLCLVQLISGFIIFHEEKRDAKYEHGERVPYSRYKKDTEEKRDAKYEHGERVPYSRYKKRDARKDYEEKRDTRYYNKYGEAIRKRFINPAQLIGGALNLGAGLVNAGTDLAGSVIGGAGQLAQGAGQSLTNLI